MSASRRQFLKSTLALGGAAVGSRAGGWTEGSFDGLNAATPRTTTTARAQGSAPRLPTQAHGARGHAQMVEPSHELLRRILLKAQAQLWAEGIHVPFGVTMAECLLTKSCLITVASQTPYRAL